MKIEDCPDLLHLDVVLKRVRAEPCLLPATLPSDTGDVAGVALVYELQLGKRLIESEGAKGIAPFVAEVRIPADVFESMPADKVCALVLQAVERDLDEAVLVFAKHLRSEG